MIGSSWTTYVRRWLKCPYALKKALFGLTLATLFLGMASVAFQEGLASTNTLPEPEEPLHLYSNQGGTDLDKILRRAIQRCQRSLYIEIYNLSDERVIALLNQKAKEGVEIRVIVDGKYYPRLRSLLHGVIQVEAGKTTGGLMHRKIVVADQMQVWFGSANFTWESLKSDSNLLAGLCSEELARIFIDPTYRPYTRVDVGGQSLEVWNIPAAQAPVAQLLDAIEQAQTKIRIAMFTWTRLDLAQKLVEAKKRGLDVQVLLDHRSVEGASEEVFEFLRKNNIHVRLNHSKQTMHHKFLWIDQQELFFGSVNWTEGGFRRNRDLLVHIPHMTGEQAVWMATLWENIWSSGKKSPAQ